MSMSPGSAEIVVHPPPCLPITQLGALHPPSGKRRISFQRHKIGMGAMSLSIEYAFHDDKDFLYWPRAAFKGAPARRYRCAEKPWCRFSSAGALQVGWRQRVEYQVVLVAEIAHERDVGGMATTITSVVGVLPLNNRFLQFTVQRFLPASAANRKPACRTYRSPSGSFYRTRVTRRTHVVTPTPVDPCGPPQ